MFSVPKLNVKPSLNCVAYSIHSRPSLLTHYNINLKKLVKLLRLNKLSFAIQEHSKKNNKSFNNHLIIGGNVKNIECICKNGNEDGAR